MNLQTDTLRHLAFIKYLYYLGIQQSEKPEPLCAASLLSFHDSVESFLHLACLHLNIDMPKHTQFEEYWGLLKNKLGQELSQAPAMKRLNKARVNLKHHGILPSKIEIASFTANVTSFFEDNTPIIFNDAFSTISMTDFVQPEQARENVKAAETLLGQGKLNEALEKAAIAFQQMLDDYESRKLDRFNSSPFFFGKDLRSYSSDEIGIGHRRRIGRSLIESNSDSNHEHKYEEKLGKFIDIVKESLEATQEAIKILAMGIDYRRYSKFKVKTPMVYRTQDGLYHAAWIREMKLTPEDVQFCIEFVVETAVELQQFDYDLPTSTIND